MAACFAPASGASTHAVCGRVDAGYPPAWATSARNFPTISRASSDASSRRPARTIRSGPRRSCSTTARSESHRQRRQLIVNEGLHRPRAPGSQCALAEFRRTICSSTRPHAQRRRTCIGLHSPRSEALENQLYEGILRRARRGCAGMVERGSGLDTDAAATCHQPARPERRDDQEIAVLRVDGRMACPSRSSQSHLPPGHSGLCEPVVQRRLCAGLYATVEAAHPTAISFYLNGCAATSTRPVSPTGNARTFIWTRPPRISRSSGAARGSRADGPRARPRSPARVEEIPTSDTPIRLHAPLHTVDVPLKSLADRATLSNFSASRLTSPKEP